MTDRVLVQRKDELGTYLVMSLAEVKIFKEETAQYNDEDVDSFNYINLTNKEFLVLVKFNLVKFSN